MPNPTDIVHAYHRSGGGGGGGDYWKLSKKPAGSYPFRLYRFTLPDGTKELNRQRPVHKDGKITMKCVGEGCTICVHVDRLRASADRAESKKGYDMRSQLRNELVLIDLNDQKGFFIHEVSEYMMKKIHEFIAQIGGYNGGWPNPEKAEEVEAFNAAWTAGVERTTGPKGVNFIMVFKGINAPPQEMYNLQLDLSSVMNGGKELGFPEDDKVPDPQMVRERMEKSMAEKAAKGASK